MEEILAVCVTHMDQVNWSQEEFKTTLNGELGIESVIFSSIETEGITICYLAYLLTTYLLT